MDYILVQNVRSLNKNLDNLQVVLEQQSTKPVAVCITETWLNKNSHVQSLTLRGYQHLLFTNREKRGGGVGIYIDEKYSAVKQGEFSDDQIQLLSTKISLNKYNFSLIVGYVKPNTSIDKITCCFENFWNNLVLKENEKQFLCGDFNIDHFKNSIQLKLLKSCLETFGLHFSPNIVPSRETDKSQSCIDVIYSNSHCETNVLKTHVSDHYSVTATLDKAINLKSEEVTLTKKWAVLRDTEAQLKLKFLLTHELQKLNDLCDKITPNQFCLKLHEAVNKCVDKIVPLKRYSTSRQQSWVDNEVKNLATKKWSLYQKMIKTNNENTRNKFKRVRNQLQKLIETKKRDFYQSRIHQEGRKTSKSFFDCVKQLKGDNSEQKCKLDIKTANQFHEFFTNIGKDLAKKFSSGKCKRLYQHNRTIVVNSIEVRDIENIIKNLKNKYSCDVFGLNNFLIKTCASQLAPSITKLINMCIQARIFPECLKQAIVVPIHKGGSLNIPSNFRPISLLPIVGKIFEKVVHAQIEDFLEGKVNKRQPIWLPTEKRNY